MACHSISYQCIALHGIALYVSALHVIVLHVIALHCMSLHLTFTGNKPYTVFAQRIRVELLAARFVIYLLDMLAKLKGNIEISTNTPISK